MPALRSISVILPTRDRPRLFVEAARSALAQRIPPTELLVIDDTSGNDIAEVIGGLRRSNRVRIRVLRGPRRGPAAARNVGLRAASGELVAFLDDDDLWLPEKLEWQVAWFVKRPGLGVLGTAFRRVGEAAHVVRVDREPRRMRRVPHGCLLRANRLAMSSVVARRRCFDECGGFAEELPLAQDWDMWLRIAARWEVGVVPAPLTIYRLHGGQRSVDRVAMRRCEAEVMRRALRGWGPGARGLEGVARRRLAWAQCRLGRLLVKEGDMEGAAENLRQSICLFPYNPLSWGAVARCALVRCAPAKARL